MKRFVRKIFNIIKGMFIIIFTFVIFPFCRLFLWNKRIWLVSEQGIEARDNGYIFYKYLRVNHSDINAYYVISKNSPDFYKIEKYKKFIFYGSIKHFIYFCAARYNISSKTEGFYPSYYLRLLRKHIHLFGKYVFLQHGVIKDDLTFFYKKKAKFDLFICGAKPEFDYVSQKYGYEKSEVAYTGLARFDLYHNISYENMILIMPTWRRTAFNGDFKKSDYYLAWNEFINCKKINDILVEKNLTAYFYIHPQFKDFSYLFNETCSNIKIAFFEKADIQELIMKARMLITDFSSLAFDFGYMKKPVIYYQYDEAKFFKEHYIKGYFDYRVDGFGPVCNSLSDVINSIKTVVNNNFRISKQCSENWQRFFPLYDEKNSERIYFKILEMR